MRKYASYFDISNTSDNIIDDNNSQKSHPGQLNLISMSQTSDLLFRGDRDIMKGNLLESIQSKLINDEKVHQILN